jgi:hypothetical protein
MAAPAAAASPGCGLGGNSACARCGGGGCACGPRRVARARELLARGAATSLTLRVRVVAPRPGLSAVWLPCLEGVTRVRDVLAMFARLRPGAALPRAAGAAPLLACEGLATLLEDPETLVSSAVPSGATLYFVRYEGGHATLCDEAYLARLALAAPGAPPAEPEANAVPALPRRVPLRVPPPRPLPAGRGAARDNQAEEQEAAAEQRRAAAAAAADEAAVSAAAQVAFAERMDQIYASIMSGDVDLLLSSPSEHEGELESEREGKHEGEHEGEHEPRLEERPQEPSPGSREAASCQRPPKKPLHTQFPQPPSPQSRRGAGAAEQRSVLQQQLMIEPGPGAPRRPRASLGDLASFGELLVRQAVADRMQDETGLPASALPRLHASGAIAAANARASAEIDPAPGARAATPQAARKLCPQPPPPHSLRPAQPRPLRP